jgi:hypothetical protein
MSTKNLLALLASVALASNLAACNADECETDADCDTEAGETCVFDAADPEAETGTCEGPDDGGSGTPTGCTTDAECGAYICGDAGANGARTCLDACTTAEDCSGEGQCDIAEGATEGLCVELTEDPYSWVALVSTAVGEDSLSADNPGPDVDAIELRVGAAVNYASAVASSAIGTITGGDSATGAPNNVTGAPNDFTTPGGDCNLESATGYFAFGGAGGFVAVAFSGVTEINTGDVIKVYELAAGPTGCGNISNDRPDTFEIYIGRGAAPATSAAITGLTDTCRQGASGPNGGITEVNVNTATCN